MKLTIIVPDNLIGINGVFKHVALPEMGEIRVVQFNENVGHIEYKDFSNEELQNINAYQGLIDIWNATEDGNKEREPQAPLPLTFEEIKNKKKIEINKCRDNDEVSGFIFKDKLFDSDERSVLRIMTAALSAQLAIASGQEFSINWTISDNTTMTLTAQETMTLPLYLAINGKILHEKCSTLKALINASTTEEELNAINW